MNRILMISGIAIALSVAPLHAQRDEHSATAKSATRDIKIISSAGARALADAFGWGKWRFSLSPIALRANAVVKGF